jgi:hypothetical protein
LIAASVFTDWGGPFCYQENVMVADKELLKNIPAELRTPALWVQYYLAPNGGKKPTKHPCVAYTQRENCRSLDHLLTRPTTKGGGFQRVVEKGERLVFVDLDHCRKADTGAVEQWAQDIIDSLDSYTEISASGTGFHIVCKAVLDDDFKVDGNPIEIFSAARIQNKLIAMTGNVIDEFRKYVEDRQQQAEQLLAKVKGKKAEQTLQDAPIVDVISPTEIKAKDTDMPTECLDSWLGSVCREHMADFPRAYAWPALLAAASVLVPRDTNHRTNLFVDIDGPVHSGKSSAYDKAFKLLGLSDPVLMKLKSGSAEGLAARIGDVAGAARLLYPDELAHLLEKTAIENASFARFLTTSFYDDRQDMTVAKGKQISFNARLTVAGGSVDDQFEDLFGAVSTGGLYDRFLFGKCPTGFQYRWRPLDEVVPVIFPDENRESRAQKVYVKSDVFDERDKWLADGMQPRVAELVIRCATICASLDNRNLLTADMLAPAYALGMYQMKVRALLQPNVGLNPDAQIAIKIRNLLATLPTEKWIGRRELYRNIHAYRLGPSVFDRALRAMQFNGELEIGKQGKQETIRLIVEQVAPLGLVTCGAS